MASSGSNDGKFYVTASGVLRPFREPGIAPGAADLGFPLNVPHFDGNPERVYVDSSSCAAPAVASVGDTVSEITGALSFYNGDLAVYGCPSFTNVVAAQPLPDRGAREFTVATFNMLNFTSDPTRLTKASLAIRNMLRVPDIIGVEEVDNLTTLLNLAAQISSDASAAGQPDPGYTAQLLAPPASQNLGILYRSGRMTDVSIVEVGRDATFTDPRNGTQAKTNDRPPLVMSAKLLPPVGQPFPVTVIVNHMRSLIDVDTAGDTGDFARAKRRACAEFLANLIAQHQTAGENVISIGDYNAYEFNDGYVDVLGTVTGHPAPPDRVLLWSSDLVDPDAVDTITLLPLARRYSYVENGSAQDIDHIVVTGGLLERLFHLEIAHDNADFPKVLGSDATRPERVSDHDMPVGYFTFPPPQADLSTSISAAVSVLSGALQSYTITVTNHGPDPADNVTFTDLTPLHTTFQSITAPAGWTCTTPAMDTAGQVSCTAASLPAGASAQFTLDVAVDCSTADGTALTNVAGATSDYGDSSPNDNNATFTSSVSNPAPSLTPVNADQAVLWPPDHKMVDVFLDYGVSDNCGTPEIAVTISSNQPLNATGDGNTAYDWEIVDAHHVRLRAERAPDSQTGRTYTITVNATDSAGNAASRSVDVSVPQ